MTLLDLKGERLHSRISGRATLLRRLRGLLIAVRRYASGRAVTPDEQRWAATLSDRLTTTLHEAENHEAPRRLGTEATR